ncbi:23S rRNA (adenine(2503)-C(2))-methyltransferase RlmN [Paramagnetospirillum marisnigri]|uniref:Dual-specificity RNA methyltransferase RlmN n=1 Tax=Paramagnetospirillum marisnigri TaxID=1285242 RepID=A0A178MMA0_9PROT|nr:23S rRNA (adenine(2503)-C(2))-methyltransferase RlmN [Paramagnetospirillum marisnigri]OAN49663.1 23S rRNA (adenine(2503)-C(2))-methyltransferase RlmN [Paramagnetospirillum marisnigri]
MNTVPTKTNLIGLSRAQLAAEMDAIGEKPFRAKQLWHWMYNRGETDFAAMSSISKVMQAKLAEHFEVRRPRTEREMLSEDGTRKWLLKFDDGNEAETVFIPDLDEELGAVHRGSVCISTQVGCTLTCKFCHTGTQLLVRNLTAAEIVGQFMAGRDAYGEWPTPDDTRRLLSNIVVMGMGEPLYNFENVATALEILMDGEGIGISKRRITLSTSGVVPMMKECGERLGVNLAISLHAVTDEVRDRIMPINKKYPLKELMAACRDYPGASNARRITFEYIMLKGVNDSAADARALLKLIKGLPAKFNLIPFNPWPGSEFETSDMKTVKAFSDILQDNGYSAPIRMPRGRDILAACGQLRSESQREKASRAKARAAAGIIDEHHPTEG